MNIKSTFVIGALCALSAGAACAASPVSMPKGGVPAGWKLVSADEFDKPGLPNAAKWEYDTESNKGGWANEELQYYSRARAENSRVANGKLFITARKEKLADAPDFGGQGYTSARLFTRGRYEFTYGYVEVRAKLPCGTGTWPAIWMLGTKGDWPAMGEIDIMEHVGRKKGEVLASVHTGAYNWPNNTQKTSTTTVNTVCDKFHNYQLTWTKDSIVMGVDGRNYFEFKNPKDGDVQKWPFDTPQYLILNVAVGGNLGGPVDDKIFPVTMEVDYVRVYKP